MHDGLHCSCRCCVVVFAAVSGSSPAPRLGNGELAALAQLGSKPGTPFEGEQPLQHSGVSMFALQHLFDAVRCTIKQPLVYAVEGSRCPGGRRG